MRIHAMCLVKNEVDILRQTLLAAAKWCDQIYVFDNGSSDGTWDLVNSLSAENSRIVAYKQDPVPFHDRLRSHIFEQYRSFSAPGDWWCRLDADEFYPDDPRAFLVGVRPKAEVVWTANLSYYFTDRDAERYDRDPSLYADSVPVQERCRYYLNHWSEPRFFRYHRYLRWTWGGFPDGTMDAPAHPSRLLQQHFPYRSPAQIAQRLATRRAAIAEGEFLHEALPNWGDVIAGIRDNPERRLVDPDIEHAGTDWRQRLVPADSLNFDAHDGTFIINENLMPPLPAKRPLVQRVRKSLGRAKRAVLNQ